MFFNSCKTIAVLFLALQLFFMPDASAVIYKKYYSGLPDFEKQRPFSEENKLLQKELKIAVDKISISEQKNQKISTKEIYTGIVKIHNANDNKILLSFMQKMAPSLNPKNLKFWISQTEQNRELIVGYTFYDKENNDPYFSIWLFRWMGNRYRIDYAGHFLAGDLHAIKAFGPKGVRTIFIKFQSCTECCPWVYLVALDFINNSDGKAFEFTYNDDRSSWRPEIEYILPGKGHSIDAKVETKIPKIFSEGSPHLIQHFKIDGDGEEWWVFKCSDYKCDFEFYKKGLPTRYQKFWKNEDNL